MIEDQENRTYVTNDMSFAAYLISVHDFKLASASKLGRARKFELFTDIEGPPVNTLKLRFIGSDVQKFDNTVRDLKRMLFSDTGD